MPNEKAKTEGKEVKAEKPGLQQSLKTNSPKIAKSVFGAVLVEALKEKHKPSTKISSKDILFKAAKVLSKITKTVKVIKEAIGKGTVKMEIDLEKIPLGPDNKRLTAKDILTPDVKKFSISVDGAKAQIVERKDVNGNIDYYYQDEKGELTLLELPNQGIATVKIRPEDIDGKAKEEILEIMKKQIRKATKKNRKKQTKAVAKALKSKVKEQKVKESKAPESKVQIETVRPARSPSRRRRSPTSDYAGAVAESVAPPAARTAAPAEAVAKMPASIAAEYKAHIDNIKRKLNPSKVSEIPETPLTKEIPKKEAGTIRLGVFGDTDAKKGRNTDQLNLKQLQKKCPEWEADFAIGVGDHIYDLGRNYKKMLKKVKGEFQQFRDLPFALALGNHDDNSNGKTDYMQDLYKDKLPEFEGNKSAYSFTFGNATFVVLNWIGSRSVSKKQTEFFRKKSKEAKGAVYLVNHIPPFQDAFGRGLNERSGKSILGNFKEIQKIAKENIENNGRPFYILSGHTHFSHVIGNYLNPGGMGMNYSGLKKGRLMSVRSAAVVDIDKETGAIKNVYFRTAESGFEDPIPQLQHDLAWNTLEATPESAPAVEPKPTEKAVAEKTPEPAPPEFVSADDYVPKHPKSGNAGRPFNYFQRNLTTSKGKIQISTSGRLGVTTSAKKHITASQSRANSQAKKLKERGIQAIISLSGHKETKRAAQAVGLEHYRGYMPDKYEARSVTLFNKIASYLRQGKSIHIHCRYGTHRARTGLAGGLLAAGYAKSVGEAFKMVGLRYSYFGTEWDYFTAVIKYARSKGIKVETPQELRSKYGVTGSGIRNYSKGHKSATS